MYTPGSGRSTYARLSQQADEIEESNPSSVTVVPRPQVYYGEGPFDPPSSDDEDVGLLEKTGPLSPGSAERGGNDTIIRRKVCPPQTAQCSFSTCTALHVATVSRYLSCITGGFGGISWYIYGYHIPRINIPRVAFSAYNHG
jgi:dipeptidyl aminopeptidase